MTRGRRWAASTGEDELLAQLYQQITERQALRFAVEYDMAAGLDRYRAWLAEPATEAPAAIQLQGSTTLRGSSVAGSASQARYRSRPAAMSYSTANRSACRSVICW